MHVSCPLLAESAGWYSLPMARQSVASVGSACYGSASFLWEVMGLALTEAEAAYAAGEVPVGAVILWDGEVISRGHNLRETENDPFAHAEMLAMGAAARRLKRWRLDRATLVVTLEPCPMCMGAVLQARIPRLVYGAPDPKGGMCGTLYDLSDDPRLNHRVEVVRGVRAEEAGGLLSRFFEGRRG